jgi:hypothetical protein
MTIIVILLITNVFTITTYSLKEEKPEKYIYLNTNGTTGHWKIQDLKITYTPDSFEHSDAVLTYIGDEKLNPHKRVEVFFYNAKNKEYASRMGQVNQIDNSLRLGSGGVSGKIKNPPSIQDIKKWYVLIKWDGKQEKMNLKF